MKGDTVDGRNPGPVHISNIPLFTEFQTSQVVQDFFHQQYVYIYIYLIKEVHTLEEKNMTGWKIT